MDALYMGLKHKVDRVHAFSPVVRIRSPHPLTHDCGEEVGGPNSDEGTDTLVLFYIIISLRI
jgi:hypothetical protein